ncbi:MAG: hypothetical protein ACQERZ_06665 [Fusobacteriota bacterium]
MENRVPKFEKGSILKKGMLEALRDYPKNFIDIFFEEYSDGILEGCKISVNESYIVINKGIIKLDGCIYILDDKTEIDYPESNVEVVIKISILEEENRDYDIKKLNITSDENKDLLKNELELGRFKLRKGADLRTTYSDFFDFKTEYNTLNIINCKYSSTGGTSISPKILREFGKKALEINTMSPIDIIFAYKTLESGTVNREIIKSYISKKLSIKNKEFTNLQMYNYLKDILMEFDENGDNEVQKTESHSYGRIIVD